MTAAPPPDRPASDTPQRVLASIARVLVGCVIVVGVCAATLGATVLYGQARRQETLLIIPPDAAYARAVAPPPRDVLAAMGRIASAWMRGTHRQEARQVAFTFDDGPYAMLTPQLLDLLRRQHVPATFFIEGKDAQMHPELVRRIVDDGHELGNHSFTHASLIGLDEAGIRRELGDTDALIRCLTGVAAPLMRPPGGRLDASRFALVQRLGYTIVNDNDNPGDYRESDPHRLYTFILNHSSRNTIVCLHSGRLVTIRALPTIIDAYRRKGVRFVTISEMAQSQGIDVPPLPPAGPP